MLGEKIELTDHVDSIYDFILDVDYKYQEIIMKLYKKGELEDEIQLLGDYENKKISFCFTNIKQKEIFFTPNYFTILILLLNPYNHKIP